MPTWEEPRDIFEKRFLLTWKPRDIFDFFSVFVDDWESVGKTKEAENADIIEINEVDDIKPDISKLPPKFMETKASTSTQKPPNLVTKTTLSGHSVPAETEKPKTQLPPTKGVTYVFKETKQLDLKVDRVTRFSEFCHQIWSQNP